MGKEVISEQAEMVIKRWLQDPYNNETREEIKRLVKENPQEANDAFSGRLAFGTGGIRGLMGPGTNRINLYTIRMVTQGLAEYIKTFPRDEWKRGVVICHDCRINSREFAEECARVLAGNGIVAHLTPALRPTPFCSFCVRHFKAIAGINITASHNPKEYNGYKVYWEDGAQVVSPHAEKIVKAVENVKDINDVKLAELDNALISTIDKNAEEAYYKSLMDLTLHPDRARSEGKHLQIVYSPLNGAGGTMIPEALRRAGFSEVSIVKEQEKPDGHFLTTPYPNPETDAALELGWRDLKEQQADLLLVSDPDSDRLSLSILHKGMPKRLTGNELGILMLHQLIKCLKPAGKWATVTTIVSSPLIKAMTEKNGGTCFEVLTGFKYIGEKIHQWEEEKDGYDFLFGMEESLGYLHGTHARDKDATIAALLAAETALELKLEDRTLLDLLYSIYETYGIYREGQKVVKCKDGMQPMLKMMGAIRQNLPKQLLGIDILRIEDYQTSKSLTLPDGKEGKLTLPKSNVLLFELADKSRFIMRPSGTEPMLKIYGQIQAPHGSNIESSIMKEEKRLEEMLGQIENEYFKM